MGPLRFSFNKPATIKLPLKAVLITRRLLLQVYCIRPTVGAIKVSPSVGFESQHTEVEPQQEELKPDTNRQTLTAKTFLQDRKGSSILESVFSGIMWENPLVF